MIVKAMLIARSAYDGAVEVKDEIPLGQEYLIDTRSLKTLELVDTRTGKPVTVTMVRDVMVDEWLPAEMLSWEGKEDTQKATKAVH